VNKPPGAYSGVGVYLSKWVLGEGGLFLLLFIFNVVKYIDLSV